jgi:PAS domain-containing protein
VVLTGLNDETLAVEALRGGAQDYLIKGGLSLTDLSRALRYAIERKRTEEELRKSRSELLRQHQELSKLFKEIETVKNDWEDTMDVLGDMVILVGPEGRIKRCNNAFREFTKKSHGPRPLKSFADGSAPTERLCPRE